MAKLEEEEENRRKRLKLNFDDERERKENCEIERKGKRIVKEEERKTIFGTPTSEIEEVRDEKHGREGPSEIEVRDENGGRESFSEIEEVKDEHSRGGVLEIEKVKEEHDGRGEGGFSEIEEEENDGYHRRRGGGRVFEIEEEIEEVRDEDNRRGRVSEVEEEEDEYNRKGGGGFSEIEEEDDIEEEEEGLRRRGRYRRREGRVSEIEEVVDERDGGGIVSEIEEEEDEYNRRFLSFRRVTEIEELDDEEKISLSPSTRFSDEIRLSPIIGLNNTPQSPDYLEKREKAKFQFKRDWKEFKKVLIEWEERIVWKSNHQHVLEKERELKRKNREINREALNAATKRLKEIKRQHEQKEKLETMSALLEKESQKYTKNKTKHPPYYYTDFASKLKEASRKMLKISSIDFLYEKENKKFNLIYKMILGNVWKSPPFFLFFDHSELIFFSLFTDFPHKT
uniref:Uncharacterized protein n=2 Tax=Meloidogyne TaxID=189290 RepID=A0A6V7UYH1_MELEN|nr:unnamed protein product [Meloidogyne enterolobii]